jgi:hypothetical protein
VRRQQLSEAQITALLDLGCGPRSDPPLSWRL